MMVHLSGQDIKEKSALECLKFLVEKKHHFNYLQKEEATKMHIINPILKVIGWDIEELDRVKIESNGADYILTSKRGFRIPIEAKGLGTSIERQNGKPVGQLEKFCKGNKFDFGIFTDGNKWELYKLKGDEFEVIWKINIEKEFESIQKRDKILSKLGMISYKHIDNLRGAYSEIDNRDFLELEKLDWEKPTLEKTLSDIKKKSENLEINLNENACKYKLINPILRALGWNTRNPNVVIPDVEFKRHDNDIYPKDKKFPDYILRPHQSYKCNSLVLEAKELSENLLDGIKQLGEYCLLVGSELGILTNGLEWKIYKVNQTSYNSGNLEGEIRKLFEVNLRNIEDQHFLHEIKIKLERISRDESKTNFTDLLEEEKDKKKEIEVKTKRKENRKGKIVLSKEEKNYFHNYEVLTQTAEWLINQGNLDEDAKIHSSLLGSSKRGEIYLIHPDPSKIIENKSSSSPERLSNGLYIDTNRNSRDAKTKARQLLEFFGYLEFFNHKLKLNKEKYERNLKEKWNKKKLSKDLKQVFQSEFWNIKETTDLQIVKTSENKWVVLKDGEAKFRIEGIGGRLSILKRSKI